jgi:hypothetical protein
MVDTAPTPVVVPANAGLIDGAQAALRYIAFLITATTAILALLKAHDAAGLIAYIQANAGQIGGAISGLIALGIAAYGVFKTHKRGAQIATVALNPAVPETVATTKEQANA